VATSPFLRPLAAVLEETPAALVVFVDTGSARLIPVATAGSGDEVRLESDVPGHHRRGGWAQLAQSRYQRHILERRGQHFEAVAETLGRMVDEHGVERIVVAGSVETVAAFQRSLSPGVAARVAGSVRGSRHEPASELVARAVEVIERVAAHEAAGVLDTLLTQAAKGGQAVAGLEAALEAVQRGAVDHLFLLRGFREPGGACAGCGALQPGEAATCRLCGHAVVATELGDAMVGRTIASGGGVTVVDTHPDLARAGRVAAWLRFAL
jgi:peptide subunit release factor 1 (eRF1)